MVWESRLTGNASAENYIPLRNRRCANGRLIGVYTRAPQSFDAGLHPRVGLQAVVGYGFKKRLQPVRSEDAVGDMLGDELIEFVPQN